jgi:hypothetical protein
VLIYAGWTQLVGFEATERKIMKKIIAMALLALAIGAGLSTSVVSQSQATSGGAPQPQCTGSGC